MLLNFKGFMTIKIDVLKVIRINIILEGHMQLGLKPFLLVEIFVYVPKIHICYLKDVLEDTWRLTFVSTLLDEL